MTIEKNEGGPPESRVTFAAVWKSVVSIAGLVGVFILLLFPHLRDPSAWAVFSGMAGVIPFDKLIEKLGPTAR